MGPVPAVHRRLFLGPSTMLTVSSLTVRADAPKSSCATCSAVILLLLLLLLLNVTASSAPWAASWQPPSRALQTPTHPGLAASPALLKGVGEGAPSRPSAQRLWGHAQAPPTSLERHPMNGGSGIPPGGPALPPLMLCTALATSAVLIFWWLRRRTARVPNLPLLPHVEFPDGRIAIAGLSAEVGEGRGEEEPGEGGGEGGEGPVSDTHLAPFQGGTQWDEEETGGGEWGAGLQGKEGGEMGRGRGMRGRGRMQWGRERENAGQEGKGRGFGTRGRVQWGGEREDAGQEGKGSGFGTRGRGKEVGPGLWEGDGDGAGDGEEGLGMSEEEWEANVQESLDEEEERELGVDDDDDSDEEWGGYDEMPDWLREANEKKRAQAEAKRQRRKERDKRTEELAALRTFEDLGVSKPLCKGLQKAGFVEPTRIQKEVTSPSVPCTLCHTASGMHAVPCQ